MMQTLRKAWAKVLLSILCVLSLTIGTISMAGVIVLAGSGCFSGENRLFRQMAMDQMHQDSWDVIANYFDPEDPAHPWTSYYSGGIYTGENSNFIYTITDSETGETVLTSFDGTEEVYRFHTTHTQVATVGEHPVKAQPDELNSSLFTYNGQLFFYESDGTFRPAHNAELETTVALPDLSEIDPDVGFLYQGNRYQYDGAWFFETDEPVEEVMVYEERSFDITGYLRSPLPYRDTYSSIWQVSQTLFLGRNVLVAGCIGGLLLGIILLILLMCLVGHTNASPEIQIPFILRPPLDLALVLGAIIIGCGFGITGELQLRRYLMMAIVLGCIVALLSLTIIVYYLLCLAVRVKTHTVISSSLCGRLLRRCRRAFCWMLELCRRGLGMLPLLWRVGVCYLGIFLVEFVLINMFSYGMSGGFWFLWFVLKVLLGAGVCYVTICFRKLKIGAEAIAAGDFGSKVTTEKLVLDFKDTAETLNHIQDGMNIAVESRMKSERLKTELITNVSHDIKTPLTSIVSYVDLMKKEPLGSQQAGAYLEVIDRQSQRLKKLVEDLLEASKASTGNIAVALEPLDLGMLLGQALGEYSERLENVGIVPVLRQPEESVMVQADGRLLWRVFDNLLGNVVKYGLPGTRLYGSILVTDQAVITFRNISREPLNISEDELMERFVRGDSSRHTEGSGLGLSIAKSLTESMGGRFSLKVDGDLFKAEIQLPLVEQSFA